MTTVVIVSGTSFTTPSDWNDASNTVQVISAGASGNTGSLTTGGNGGSGGGSGGFATTSNISITGSVPYQIGVGNGSSGASGTSASFFDGTATNSCAAGIQGAVGINGAVITSSTGTATGGAAGGAGGSAGFGGGGGAPPGPNGAGGAGQIGRTGNVGGGGTGDGGTGGAGGADGGFGGGAGNPGTAGTEMAGSVGAGGGGGGGGTGNVGGGQVGGAGGAYGGGGGGGGAADSFGDPGTGGAGTGGVIVLQYTPAPNPPVANPVSATVGENSGANNIPLNITGGTPTSVAVSTNASHGNAVASGITISYTPNSNFVGSDSFQYTASNAGGTSSPATASISVVAPTALFDYPNPLIKGRLLPEVGPPSHAIFGQLTTFPPFTREQPNPRAPGRLVVNDSAGVPITLLNQLAGIPFTPPYPDNPRIAGRLTPEVGMNFLAPNQPPPPPVPPVVFLMPRGWI